MSVPPLKGLSSLLVVVLLATVALAQGPTVTVTRNVNLRPDPSSEYPPIRLLKPSEPPLTLLDQLPQSGYYYGRTQAGEEGYVWSHNVHVSTGTPATTTIALGPGVPGSASMTGCGDGLWQHVYKLSRLLVRQDCLTVTGTIVDATASQSHHQADGMRHEPDGDTHGWLQVDPQFASLINDGNTADEGGYLVLKIVCHYTVSQADSKPFCTGFADHTSIQPVWTHVAITGTIVTEKNHGKWNEIHPVSSITIQ
jgi:hypothetical protein